MKLEDALGLMIPVTYVVFLVIERFAARRGYPEVRGWRLTGGAFVIVLLAINATLPSLLPAGWLASHRLLDGARLGTVGGALVGYLAVSFVQYWFHRAEHRFGFMWRYLHQLHHAPVRMDLSGSAYTHPLEVAVSATLFVAVTTFALGLTPLAAALCGYIGAFYSMFQHLNVRTPAWLGYVIERPESHGLHHQREVHARNYSDLPLWDIAFGTFANPARFDAEVGFDPAASRRLGAMLLGLDVNERAQAPAFAPEVRA